MIKNFKQFVPSSVCLKCDGCCRFKEADSRWRPHITQTERQEAAKPGLAQQVFAQHVIGPDQRINATPCGQGHICHFLDPQKNTCGIYHARPFECQLYPFLLGIEDGQKALFVHLNCPYIQEHFKSGAYEQYVQYLRQFFQQPSVRVFLEHNPSSFTDYSAYRDELDCLFVIATP